MKLTYYHVDAFAGKVFKGNPAAVIPLDQWLPDELMQQIAMENNLSETAFFVKQSTSQNERTTDEYHLRWFTPEYEIDLCGHATLATAYIINNFIKTKINEIHFSTEKAGILKTFIKNETYTLDFPSRMPVTCTVPELLYKCLRISETVEVLKSRDYFVVLPTEDDVVNIKPDFTSMNELDTIGVIVTAKGKSADVVSRCFYPGMGIPEDPVTGSAHCNLVPYWSEKLKKNQLFCKQLSQRGGDLHCELVGSRVMMSGNCVLYAIGEISI